MINQILLFAYTKKTKLEDLLKLIKPHTFNSMKLDKTLHKHWDDFHKLLSLIVVDLISGNGINELIMLLNKNSNKKQIT